MDRPPRNRELERLVVDALRSAPSSGARSEAWQVYADWLLSRGEPVGEWLAASLGADDASDAAAPIRATLADVERACRFRLIDPELADLSEVPELARIAELTWERGFITTASLHARQFRPWDSELLGHTPDRLLAAILRSPSACMLHTLQLDRCSTSALGARHRDFTAVLADLDAPLSLRELELGSPTVYQWVAWSGHFVDRLVLDPHGFRWLPELERLALHSDELGRPPDAIREAIAPVLVRGALPRLRQLALSLRGAGDLVVDALLGSDRLAGLGRLEIGFVGEVGAERLLAASERLAELEAVVLHHVNVEPSTRAALIARGVAMAGP